MAYEIPGYVYSVRNADDIVQFRAVTLGPDGAQLPGVFAAQRIDGVAQMPALLANPETIRVMKTGITFARTGAAVTVGQQVEADALGDFVPLAAGRAAGRALTAAAGAGQYIALLLY